MEEYQALIASIGLALGASWASGINLYAVMLALGLSANYGVMELPETLSLLQEPVVLLAAGLMYCVEFFADKTPGVDSLWDGIHSFVRLPAGALLAAGAVGEVGPALEVAAAIVGGGLAATSHVSKSSLRLLINTSPEPVTNWAASVGEDALVLSGIWLAVEYPIMFSLFLVLFLGLVIWFLPKIWSLLGTLFSKLKKFMNGNRSHDLSQPTGIGVNSELDQLERLSHLLHKGAITQDEYEFCKARLLQPTAEDSASS